ncbi:phosphoenolpyruvate--protein phosphotransferase [Microcella alkaliphila]|uniref:Phosphoenolpyruvate-protein phosphotransferase n=1 Tax=Microcella alkaliphila TaxID=279828 RepID=A0A4Q7TQ58_9MICO|nr:phosphoenolpyruvate--protein phosphotransferase [Microcella alkaliphila]RZT62220.1 phosphoenolpyruvate--protein phosphotransferase [Microcella alkaliphila]
MVTTELIRGVGIGRGTAVGPVLRMPDPVPDPADARRDGSAEDEQARATEALAATSAQLRARGQAAGGTAAEVLDALAMMADDPALAADVTHRIDDGATAEYAIHAAMASFRDMLASMGGYLGERAGDLDDVARRAIAHLMGLPEPGVPRSDTPFILVARDLAPADTATLDLDSVLALVTTDGGPTSHTAILAREKGITAVVGATGAAELVDGDQVLVDAENGTVERDPDQERVDLALQRTAALSAIRAASTGPGRLADGHAVPLLANIGSIDSAREAAARGAEGVGLFRTEVLFLGAEKAPSIDEQADTYRAVFAEFPDQKVVVRVLDAGADKPLAFLTDQGEENPALGRRGLRALQAHEQVLRDQLTALAKAAAASDAHVQVMAPMVSTPEEAEYFRALAHELGVPTAGVMVEVPSAAILADHLVPHADFVSIGTNDLTQYVFAADRLLGTVAHLQDPWHPAVLRLIETVGRAGAENGVPVGICGEAAADPSLAIVLVGLGATTLSMSSTSIADVRAELSQVTLDDARRLAALAASAPSAEAARRAVADARS